MKPPNVIFGFWLKPDSTSFGFETFPTMTGADVHFQFDDDYITAKWEGINLSYPREQVRVFKANFIE